MSRDTPETYRLRRMTRELAELSAKDLAEEFRRFVQLCKREWELTK